jgi:4-amino-4-deoxy-L-arabinose transferase-like glycosyltransferase
MTHSIAIDPRTGPSARRQRVVLVVAVFAAALAIRLASFTGLIGSDDVRYARYAWRIADGTYQLEPHQFAIRYGVLVPVAALFRLFGVQEWTMVVLPLIGSSLAAALTALIAARVAGLSAAWVAGLLMATFPVDVRYASVLLPEPLLQAVLLGGVLLFLRAGTRQSDALGLAAGVVFGLSYLTKEPGIFVAVALGAFALLRRQWRLVLSLAAGVALVLAAELAWYWMEGGDLLFRLHATAAQQRSRGVVAANAHLPMRLGIAYPRMMLVPNVDFGLHSLVGLGLAAVGLARRKPADGTWLLLLLWALVPFLYLNFGTSSFSRYWALPAAPRYISLVYPPLFVWAASVLVGWAGARRDRQRWVGLAVAVVCVAGIACAVSTRGTGYRAEDVRRLTEIATVARRHDHRICEVEGVSRIDAESWRLILEIVAPDRLGCSGPTVLQVLPDSNGRPVGKIAGR